MSIAVISFNQRDYIREALQSIVDQDYPNVQIVVSDDQSTDGTQDEIAAFGHRVIALLNNDNAGITENSNRALRACDGDYFCIMGGDDILLPGKISRQVEWLEARRERVLCGHQVQVFYEDGSPSHSFQRRLRSGRGAGEVIRYGAFAACSAMVRSEAIPSYGFDNRLSLVSDLKLYVDVLSNGGEYGYIPGIHARYRRHSANVSADTPAMLADVGIALALIEEQYPQYSRECRCAKARLIDYQEGQMLLSRGLKREARRKFLKVIGIEPLFPRPWLGLLRTFPSLAIR